MTDWTCTESLYRSFCSAHNWETFNSYYMSRIGPAIAATDGDHTYTFQHAVNVHLSTTMRPTQPSSVTAGAHRGGGEVEGVQHRLQRRGLAQQRKVRLMRQQAQQDQVRILRTGFLGLVNP